MYADGGGGGLSVPPGDPGALHAAASKLDSAANAMGGHGASVKSLSSEVPGRAGWSGSAADGFTSKTAGIGGQVATVEAPLHEIASALRTFATALEAAQSKAKAAISQNDQATALPAKQADKAASQMEAASSACSAAWSSLEAAASACASQINGAVGEFPVQLDAPPQAATAANEAGSPVGQGWDWFNKWVTGWGNTTYGLATTPAAVAGGIDMYNAWRSATALPSDLQAMWDATVGPMGLAYDRGLVSYEQLASHAENALLASQMFGTDAEAGMLSATRRALSFADSGAMSMLGRVSLGLGAVGDVATIADGDARSSDRWVAGANLVGTGMVGAGALGLVGATSVIPVVGEVVMVGTGLYLAGSWLYDHWDGFHDFVNGAGDFVTQDVPDFFTQDIPDGFNTVKDWAGGNIADPISDGAGEVKDFFTDDVGGFVGGLL